MLTFGEVFGIIGTRCQTKIIYGYKAKIIRMTDFCVGGVKLT